MITARQIVDALHAEGWLDASFCNTGGGVFNVVFEPICQHDIRLGSVNLSEDGGWGSGDLDTPAESVGVECSEPNGDWLGESGIVPDWRVVDVRGAVLAVEYMTDKLSAWCADCGGAA